MFSWLKERLIFGWVKSLLEKLPFDGWKTVLGALLVALGAMLNLMPEYPPYIQVAINLLNYVGADSITDMGVVTLITGAVHKLIKLFYKPAL